jgi:hypothetical protein
MVVQCDECPGKDHKTVKVVVTFGLVALVALGALLVVVGQRIAPRIEAGLGWETKQGFTPGGVSYDEGRSGNQNTFPVNEQAAREIKKQAGNFDGQPAQPPYGPRPTPGPSSFESKPTGGRYSVSLFVGTDRKSQEFLDWWNTDSNLQALRSQVDFNSYTKDNPLYKARYSDLVPVADFPAVIFADPRGGHIYAAAGSSLPSSRTTLYSEIHDAYGIHEKLQQQPADSDPIQSEDCPDGNCKPPSRTPFVNPERERLFPIIKPRQPDPIESILYWLWNPGEAILYLLCALGLVVLALIVTLKVVRS